MIPPSTNISIQKLCIDVNLPATPPFLSCNAVEPPAPTPRPFDSARAENPLLINSRRHCKDPPISISPLRYNSKATKELDTSFILGLLLSLSKLIVEIRLIEKFQT